MKLPEALLSRLRGRDYPVRGIMELEYIFSGASVGKANERSSCAAIALAVDADSGRVHAPGVTDSTVPPADALAKFLVDAVQTTGFLPRKIHLRNRRHKASSAALMDSFGVNTA